MKKNAIELDQQSKKRRGMRSRKNENYLIRLNRKFSTLDFQDVTWHNESTDTVEAHYFGFVIRVSFPNAVRNPQSDPKLCNTFVCELYDISAGYYMICDYAPFETELDDLNEVIGAIRDYIATRPFTVFKYARGLYRLFDPNGVDYCGEYLSLADAKRTSGQNFRMEESLSLPIPQVSFDGELYHKSEGNSSYVGCNYPGYRLYIHSLERFGETLSAVIDQIPVLIPVGACEVYYFQGWLFYRIPVNLLFLINYEHIMDHTESIEDMERLILKIRKFI